MKRVHTSDFKGRLMRLTNAVEAVTLMNKSMRVPWFYSGPKKYEDLDLDGGEPFELAESLKRAVGLRIQIEKHRRNEDDKFPHDEVMATTTIQTSSNHAVSTMPRDADSWFFSDSRYIGRERFQVITGSDYYPFREVVTLYKITVEPGASSDVAMSRSTLCHWHGTSASVFINSFRHVKNEDRKRLFTNLITLLDSYPRAVHLILGEQESQDVATSFIETIRGFVSGSPAPLK